MLLSTLALMLAAGAGVWLIGRTYSYAGLAAVGAVLLIASGGAVALSDVEVKSGETIEYSYTTVDGQTVVDSEDRTTQYKTTALSETVGGDAGPLSVGGLLMLVGGVLFINTINEEFVETADMNQLQT